MVEHFPLYLTLIVAILLLIMLANRLKVAYPVLLVVAGLLISFIPEVPKIHINPELIFIVFLPPLLYEAAWAISFKELWRWRRIISSFAFIVVFLTAWAVALVANALIPGFTLALGFLLGGIVSPPDAVSANAILKFVKVPRRISSILEGESLLNDASSLMIFRFAILAVATGQFIWYKAALSFVWMVFGGLAVGLLVGWLFYKLHRYLPTDTNMDIVFSIITPYVMYIAAEQVHSSGVLSVVCGGLLLSNLRHRFLTSASRIRGVNVWESFVFVLNGIVFLLIGLDLPEITDGLANEDVTFRQAIGYGILITTVLIVVRILASYGAVLTTKIASHFINVADANPGYKAPMLISWTGMRGVVSLAAALSIPVYLEDGSAFPQRNVILFITFIVILSTLLLQGLTLPTLIKIVNMPDSGDYMPEHEAEHFVKQNLANNTLQYISTNHNEHINKTPLLKLLVDKLHGKISDGANLSITEEEKKIYLDVLEHQRKWLLAQNAANDKLDEEVVRKHLHQIDIEEEKLKYM